MPAGGGCGLTLLTKSIDSIETTNPTTPVSDYSNQRYLSRSICSLFDRILCESSLTRLFAARIHGLCTAISPFPSYLLSAGCSPAIIYPTPGAPYSVAPFVKAPCTLLHGAQALVSEVATSPFPGSLCPLIY